MEDDFGALYQGLIRGLEPDPARLREAWKLLSVRIGGVPPPDPGPPHCNPGENVV